MKVIFNGEPRVVDDGATVATLVPPTRGVAVAVNGVVVPLSSWQGTRLYEDDAVEVVTAHQGG